MSYSGEEHHFPTDADADMTFPQPASAIQKNGHIVINNRPCKVIEVSISKNGENGDAMYHFVGVDIFTRKKLEDIVPSYHNCDVPHVLRGEYLLTDISEDGCLDLMNDDGYPKDGVKLPTDETLQAQIRSEFEEGKELILCVISAMGEEQVCSFREKRGGSD